MVIYKAVNYVQLARLNILCLGLDGLSEWGCPDQHFKVGRCGERNQ